MNKFISYAHTYIKPPNTNTHIYMTSKHIFTHMCFEVLYMCIMFVCARVCVTDGLQMIKKPQ